MPCARASAPGSAERSPDSSFRRRARCGTAARGRSRALPSTPRARGSCPGSSGSRGGQRAQAEASVVLVRGVDDGERLPGCSRRELRAAGVGKRQAEERLDAASAPAGKEAWRRRSTRCRARLRRAGSTPPGSSPRRTRRSSSCAAGSPRARGASAGTRAQADRAPAAARFGKRRRREGRGIGLVHGKRAGSAPARERGGASPLRRPFRSPAGTEALARRDASGSDRRR